MSYCVEYNPELAEQYPTAIKPSKKFQAKGIVWILMTVICAYILLQTGYIRYLLPGDPENTITAFSELVGQIGNGEPIGDAVKAFCQEIITNGS